MLPRTPKGYRRIKVGEVIPHDALFFEPYTKKYVLETSVEPSFKGESITHNQYGYYFLKMEKSRYKKSRKAWKEPADVVFNSIFPVEDMDLDDSLGYIAALIEAKYTEAEFRKACKKMAEQRLDALGEDNG